MGWFALLREFWKPLAGALLVAIGWFALHHYGAARFTSGYQQAVSENAKALDVWQKKYDAIVAADAARLQLARKSHELEIAQLAVDARKPLPAVVCHAAPRSAGPVPAATVISGGTGSAPGLLPADPDVHPDISGALDLLVQRADRLSADARELNTAAHPP